MSDIKRYTMPQKGHYVNSRYETHETTRQINDLALNDQIDQLLRRGRLVVDPAMHAGEEFCRSHHDLALLCALGRREGRSDLVNEPVAGDGALLRHSLPASRKRILDVGFC